MLRYINLFFKRMIDIIGSLIGLLILSPMLLLIAILIKINSKGEIFFKQERLGKDGHIFKIIKFRTMVMDAEIKGAGIKTSKNDPRITGIGSFLRKTSLDELPQLFNVLKGDMSIVGPRPPITYHPYKFNEYPKEKIIRFKMRPGLTGLAQVKVRNSVSWDERIVYDVNYINNNNIFIDFKIMFQTIFKLFRSENIYKEK